MVVPKCHEENEIHWNGREEDSSHSVQMALVGHLIPKRYE